MAAEPEGGRDHSHDCDIEEGAHGKLRVQRAHLALDNPMLIA